MVRAKFYCESIQHSNIPGTDAYANITLRPVFGSYGDGDPDGVNKQWSKQTPSGLLQMCVTNAAAIDEFELGKTYFLDFTPV
jgi:hypothetical protein